MIDVLGREAIESLSPFEPLLRTRDVFLLKEDPLLERRCAQEDVAGRRAVLAAIADDSLAELARLPPAPLRGAEWYASVEQPCAVIDRVADEPAATVDTGLVDRAGWSSVAAKGGSEAGVLNVTARLVANDGTTWCLAVTWNGVPGTDDWPVALHRFTLRSAFADVVSRLQQMQ